MKQLIIAFFIGCIIAVSPLSTATAQDSSLSAIVPYTTFPLGAIRYVNIDTLEQLLGMNFGYNFTDIRSTNRIKQVSPPLKTTVNLRDPFYFDTTAVHYSTSSSTMLEDAYTAHEVRSYLPNTSGILNDDYAGWNTKAGGNWVSDSTQWKINTSDSVDVNNYVLKDLSDGARWEPYYGNGHYEAKVNPDHIGSASYEFVFFIDTNAFSLNHDLPLYQLEYWVKQQGSSTWSMVDSQAISYNSYNNLGYTNYTVSGHTGMGDSLKFWGNKSTVHQFNYRTFKKIINIRPYYNGFYPAQAPGDRLEIDVRLKSFHKWNIFPRLLRIRDWRGQRLLTGKADSVLKLLLNTLKSLDNSSSLSAWVLGDEPYPKHFRAWAYTNELFQIQGAQPPVTLSPAYHEQFIRTLRDQLGTSRFPGAVWFDSYPLSPSLPLGKM